MGIGFRKHGWHVKKVFLEEDGSLVFSANNFAVSDPDNSPIDFSVTVMAGDNYSISSDSVTVLPAPDFNGDLSVGVKVGDGDKSDMAMISLSVTPVNDALVISDVSDATATEETSFSTSVSWTDVDGADAVSDITSNNLGFHEGFVAEGKFSSTIDDVGTFVSIPFTTGDTGEVAIMFYAVTPKDAYIANVKVLAVN